MKVFGLVTTVVLIAVMIPVGWIGSGLLYNAWHTYTHRFRLTVEIDTPDGLRSGSGVIQNTLNSTADWLPGIGGASGFTRGEAVFVDLGEGRHVIALLAFGPRGEGVDFDRIVPQSFGRSRAFWYVDAPSWTGSAEVPDRWIPTLVTFSDLTDPKTASVLSPRSGDFEKAFGPGYRFRRAWIEMVPRGWWPANALGLSGEPVTRGIEVRLPWLRSHKGYLAGPEPDLTNTRPSKNLTGNEFIKGL